MICKRCDKERNKLSVDGYCGWCEARINGKERICKICNKTFIAHDRKAICYECRDRQEQEEAEAKRQHELDKRDPKNTTCPICGIVFDTVGGLHCHLPIHEEGYQKRQFSDKTRKRMSDSAKGKKHGPLTQSQRDAIILSNKTRIISEETKDKMRQKAIGRSVSEETRNKIRKANTGRKHTEESKRKMSAALKGRIVSEETRRKESETQKRKFQNPEYAAYFRKCITKNIAERVEKQKETRRSNWTEEARQFCDDKEYAIQILDSFDSKPTYNDLFIKLGCFTQQIGKAILKFGLRDRIKLIGGTSIEEKALFDFVRSIDSNAIHNDRIKLDGQELDVYVPDKQVAIELDGMYWHNEDWKDNSYHLNKTRLCNDNGIRLIHVFEWEWLGKQDIIKSMISSALGFSEKIYARKCKVEEIDSKISSKFLNDNHIQGNVNSSMRLGLFYEDELVAVMTFGKARFKDYDGIEMLRYAVKQNMSVIGGMSKLLKHATDKWHFTKILSYCNLSKFTGNSYEKLGFKLIRQTVPGYWWCDSDTMDVIPRYQTQMRDEVKIMKEKGYRRVWDCGTKVYELTI